MYVLQVCTRIIAHVQGWRKLQEPLYELLYNEDVECVCVYAISLYFIPSITMS